MLQWEGIKICNEMLVQSDGATMVQSLKGNYVERKLSGKEIILEGNYLGRKAHHKLSGKESSSDP